MQEQYEKIEAYLHDELSTAERKAFEAAMAEDPALAEEVHLHRRLETVLGDEAEWQLRQNLQSLRDSVPADPLEGGKPGKNRRAGSLLLGILGLIIIASLLYWYATSDATTASESAPVPEAPAPPAKAEETPLEEAEDSPPVAEENPAPPTEPIAPKPYAALPQLEELAKASPLSNIYEFELRSAIDGNAPKQLRIDGELLSAQWEGQTPFIVEIFSNNPTQYPDRPVQEGELLLQPIEEDGPIAFAAKQAYIANYEAPLDLEPGLYYYQVRLQGLDEVLWVGRLKL